MTFPTLYLNAAARPDARMAMPALTFLALRASLMLLTERDGHEVFNRRAKDILKAQPFRYALDGDGDLAMRVRWDAYWRVRPDLMRALREINRADDSDLKDAHIDAALRRLIPASE